MVIGVYIILVFSGFSVIIRYKYDKIIYCSMQSGVAFVRVHKNGAVTIPKAIIDVLKIKENDMILLKVEKVETQ